MQFGDYLHMLVEILLVASALIVGLLAFDINIFQISFVQQNLVMLVRPLQILFGVAGLFGLYQLLTCGCSCDCE